MNQRRKLLATLLVLAIAPVPSHAQHPAKVYRVGFLSSGPRTTRGVALQAFLGRMRELGYIEDRNLIVEQRYADGKSDRLAALAAELVRIPVDVVVANTTTSTAAARKATRTIPIVMGSNANPVAAGLVDSLARPGGNVTGLTLETDDLAAKRLELMKELMPSLRTVGAMYAGEIGDFPVVVQWLRDSESAARALGLSLRRIDLGFNPSRWDEVFRRAARDGVGAVTVIESAPYFVHGPELARHAIRHRIATMFPFREQAEAGGLMAYGAEVADLFRRAADFVDRILRGANPAELPVEQPTKFAFVVNRKTAEALGVAIPQSTLLRAEILG